MSTVAIIQVAIAVAMVAIVVWGIRGMFRRRAPPSDDPLDHALLWFTEADPFTVRDLLNSLLILGRTGSGKSSSSARIIALMIVKYAKSGGIILAAKPEDVGLWKGLFKLAGREADLIIFAPGEKRSLNCVDYIIKSGGSAKDVTKFLMCIGETLRSNDSDGREDGSFWQKQNERLIYLTVVVLWLALGKVSVPDMQRFINGAATSPGLLATEAWKAGFHNECLAKAFDAKKTLIEEHDLQLAFQYWLGEYPTTADKTRSSILVGVMGILHTYNSGYARELLSTETNLSPDDTLTGLWVLVNMSPSEWGDTGCLVNAAWKFLMQRRILRREAKPDDCINIIFADEAHQFINSMDTFYLAQCRSHLAAMVYISQSVSSVYGAMGEEKGRHTADALLANFTTTILHACDPITAEWASAKMGRTLQTFIGTSTPPVENMFDEMMGYSKVTYSTSEHFEKWLEPRLLMNGLRTGGKAAGYVCDAVILRSGEAVSCGMNFLFAGFSQK